MVFGTIMSLRRGLVALLLLITALSPDIWADPLVHTFSIVARDPETGEMGVAMLPRFPAAGLFPNDAALISRIRALAPR